MVLIVALQQSSSQHCIIAAIAVFATIVDIDTIDVIAAIDAIADMDDDADAKANVIAHHDMPKGKIQMQDE